MSSPIAASEMTAAASDTRPAVTVLAGFTASATGAVAEALLTADPTLLVLSHGLARLPEGEVRRTVRTHGEIIEDAVVRLEHGCLPCTLREDVLPALVRLATEHPDRDIALVLPPSVEPESLTAACGYCLVDGRPVTDAVRLDSVVTVASAARFMADLTSDDDLADRGAAASDNDARTVADVVARQIEAADTVLLWHDIDESGMPLARLSVLLHRLAPWATQLSATAAHPDAAALSAAVRNSGRFDPATPEILDRSLAGYAPGLHEPAADCGVSSMLFHARRPFHPERLRALMGTIAGLTLRGRGHLWLASQPETSVAWESAGGGLSVGSLGRWLVALPEHRWDEASAQRRVAASLDWDPYYGDRGNQLAFIGVDFDPADLDAALTACLLTDTELSAGEEAWRRLPDPFADCFPDIDDETEDLEETTT